MNHCDENAILDELSSFSIKKVPDNTQFWMVRTKGGYFYDEFLSKQFVALAWNNITKETSFSDENKDAIIDDILLQYEEIKRPTTVINKCRIFIEDINEGDILLIPNKGSSLITFAFAGSYYEEEGKSVALEKAVIDKIEHGDIHISDVSCPYKKRRHITPIKTVRAEHLNIHLYKSITNYHGLSNFNQYAFQILDQLYPCYTYTNDVRIVFHVNKPDPIGPRELSRLLYGAIDSLSMVTDETSISTQLALQSEGDVAFYLRNVYEILDASKVFLIGLVVLLGGGSFLSVKLPGVPQIIKDILSIGTEAALKREELKKAELENEGKRIENMRQLLELENELQKCGIDKNKLIRNLDDIVQSCQSMQIHPTENVVFIPSEITDQEPGEYDES